MENLFHLSEEAAIEHFVPRPSSLTSEPVVWAIDAARLRNYLVPRDCPRVTFYAGPATTSEDVQRFLGSSPAVVAIESAWFERLRTARLYCYHFAPDSFECIDACAGYFVSRSAVMPVRVEVLEDPLSELQRRAELRVLLSLWPLYNAVVASTLQFSIIRMRNAQPKPAPPQ
jgi:hypothetical protein